MSSATLQWPTKLDDWNALALDFNARIEAMGFTPRNGKSLRKKWQVLCSAKQPAEGEELTEQERRAKQINARGPLGANGQGRPLGEAEDEATAKRIKLDHDALAAGGGLASSPLAPVLPPLSQASLLSATSGDNPTQLVAEVQALLASREKAREQQLAVLDEWRRRDEQERKQFERLLQALQARSAPPPNAPPQQPQLTPPQQPPPHTLQQQQQQQPPQQVQQQHQQLLQPGSNINGGVGSNV